MSLQELFEMDNAEECIILPRWQSFNITVFFYLASSQSVNQHQWEQQAVPVTGVSERKSRLHQLLTQFAGRVSLSCVYLSVMC
jgi:hypothetical protein